MAMCSRTRWGRIDPRLEVQLVQGPGQQVLKLDHATLPRCVRQQLLMMASPSPFLNFVNKFRLDEILINHQLKGVYTMRTSALLAQVASHAWHAMNSTDRKPYVKLAQAAQSIQHARLRHFLGTP
ncbi:uncharacterized protein LOC108596932 [Drosophila busckii]|uniref:uncharacterized protein LOC108596932 n=1 Tax=Drosophila busckii TaxID=30019 RepID=UPI00083F3334|nr:uncharacterized protein LOC108596932 [Drosophila busckii]